MRRVSAVAISMALAVSLSDSLAIRAQGPGAPGAAAAPSVPQPPTRNPNEGADFGPRSPIPARSPEDEAKTFYLPAGYRMELVAAEPDVISPAVIEFDGNGRMYVVEFMSYMLDADGTGAHDPISRITRFESTNGDGRFDKRTVFADKLILPRMILPLEDGVILTNETDSDDLIRLTDTNGDGVADKKDVVYTGIGTGRDGNLEHEQNGFVWGLDNWIYSTYNAFRFRWTPGGFLREPTGNNGAQWGVSQDDDGKIWWACGGCERGYLNFQFPIHYGAFTWAEQTEPNFDTVYPIAGVSDTQGGMGRVRVPLGVLNHFTAGAGIDVVRADRLPADLQGDVLVGEPVGRLVRRAKPVKIEGLTQLRNPYPASEFILSSDLYFRPINLKSAPDGTVYIADMYHGIIQDSQWTLPGSYLRHRIEQYQLDKVVGHGRIWRLRYDGVPAVPATPAQPNASPTPGSPAVPGISPNFAPPRMYAEAPSQLVEHLSHPNGWWRDTAQRLLILKQDMSVVPALRALARGGTATPVARFHALWTLEGLGAIDAGLVREFMRDADPRIRRQGIRASETLYKAGDKSFAADYRALAKDADSDVAIQALLTLNLFKVSDLTEIVKDAQAGSKSRGVTEIGNWIMRPAAGRGGAAGGRVLTPDQQAVMERGAAIFNEICFTCHGDDGRGAPLAGAGNGVTMAPALAGSPRVQGHRDYVIKAILHGLTGPVNGATYTQVMVPMGTQKDDWVAAIASYVRNSFGNGASFVSPADVARVRATTATRKTSWTVAEIESTLPVALPVQPGWKATSSHNAAIARGALTLAGWTTAAPQTAGMWWQLELPAAVNLTEVQFDAPAGGRGFGIGSLGGGDGRVTNATAANAGGGGNRGVGAATPPPALAPKAYRVQVSLDGTRWSTPPIAEGAGVAGQNVVGFRPVQARFIRITQTAPDAAAPAWTMLNLRLFVAK